MRPADTEFAPFYAAYIARVPETDPLPALEAQPAELLTRSPTASRRTTSCFDTRRRNGACVRRSAISSIPSASWAIARSASREEKRSRCRASTKRTTSPAPIRTSDAHVESGYGRIVMGASRVAVAASCPRTAASTRST